MTIQQRIEIQDRARFEGDEEALDELDVIEHAEFLQDQIAEEEGHNASIKDEIYDTN